MIHPLADYLNQVQQRSNNLKDNPLGANQRPLEGAPSGERRGSRLLNDNTRRVVIEKVNMLLLGPTGSGRLLLERDGEGGTQTHTMSFTCILPIHVQGSTVLNLASFCDKRNVVHVYIVYA